MRNELKPCPFCGSGEIYRTYIGSSDWDFDCKGCGANTCFTVRIGVGGEPETRAANAKWNTRPQPAGECRELAEKIESRLDNIPCGCGYRSKKCWCYECRTYHTNPEVMILHDCLDALSRLTADYEALRSGILTDDLAGAIADEIMTMGGAGDVADRLVLEKEGKALGGWIRSSVINAVKSAMWEKKPND